VIVQKDGMYVPAQLKVKPVGHHSDLAEPVMLAVYSEEAFPDICQMNAEGEQVGRCTTGLNTLSMQTQHKIFNPHGKPR
jgi:hypothetical protein